MLLFIQEIKELRDFELRGSKKISGYQYSQLCLEVVRRHYPYLSINRKRKSFRHSNKIFDVFSLTKLGNNVYILSSEQPKILKIEQCYIKFMQFLKTD